MEKSSAPRSAPELLLYRRHPVEHLPGGQTLDDPNEPGGTLGRDRLHEEVHVVPIRPTLQKRDLLPRGDLRADVPKHRIYHRRDHRPAVLGRTDNVVSKTEKLW